ncbi:1-acyl-sn-glycerol-3-phosphate acyltransferase [Candidatus Aminicenantes bacterium AC-708-M15]|nr:1-acyl-sn-glycerol-3-phosphate acyltransferase [Candidatus Aminicenantes bacterium AC-335-G13]MCP2604421.1 1-acyl-sn-glycerol-3-phosphate acyltransferase [Candidatus Aminicenantes bacterium AC-708-M15]
MILICYFFITIIFGIPLILYSALTKKVSPLFKLGRFAIDIGQKISGVKIEVYGLEKIDPKRRYVYMANHQSLVDGPLLFKIIPQQLRVLLKKEVFRIPLVGIGMKVVEFVPIDREDKTGARKSIDIAVQKIKEKNYSFLIFPEGTRSLDGNLLPFKRGGFVLAIKSGVPIVPITIIGSREVLPKKKFFIKKGKIKVIFHSPIPTTELKYEDRFMLTEKVRNAIEEGLASQS